MTTLLFFDDWPLHHREQLVRRPGVPKWVPEATLEDEIVDGTWNFSVVFHFDLVVSSPLPSRR